ncbi:MAG TPA: hypothetical protein VGB87_03120, partial [Vicinamibacteria bacterium]
MIAGRVDTTDGDPGREAQGVRGQFLEWLEGGQDLLTRVSHLCDDLDESRAAAEAAREECARLRHDMAQLRHDNDELRAGSARLADELARHRAQTAGLEAEVEAIRVQNATLMDERGATAKLIADKLEDMLAQVLPRLARSAGPAPESREPAPRAETAVLAPAPVAAPPVPEPAPALSAAGAPAPAGPTTAHPENPAPAASVQGDVASAGAMRLPDWSEPAGPTADAGQPTCVMVVDDEPDFTALLADHLGSTGYTV